MAQWSVPLDKLAEKTKVDILDVYKEVASYLFARVIMLSPVDTGRFRYNWNCSIGEIDTKTEPDTDPSGNIAMSTMKSTVLEMKMGDIVYLANSLPYAMRLEYGWSRQAPNGMVRTVVREFAYKVENIVRNK